MEDDTGFISCGQDAVIYVWKLYPAAATKEKEAEVNPVQQFKYQKISFSSVSVY